MPSEGGGEYVICDRAAHRVRIREASQLAQALIGKAWLDWAVVTGNEYQGCLATAGRQPMDLADMRREVRARSKRDVEEAIAELVEKHGALEYHTVAGAEFLRVVWFRRDQDRGRRAIVSRAKGQILDYLLKEGHADMIADAIQQSQGLTGENPGESPGSNFGEKVVSPVDKLLNSGYAGAEPADDPTTKPARPVVAAQGDTTDNRGASRTRPQNVKRNVLTTTGSPQDSPASPSRGAGGAAPQREGVAGEGSNGTERNGETPPALGVPGTESVGAIAERVLDRNGTDRNGDDAKGSQGAAPPAPRDGDAGEGYRVPYPGRVNEIVERIEHVTGDKHSRPFWTAWVTRFVQTAIGADILDEVISDVEEKAALPYNYFTVSRAAWLKGALEKYWNPKRECVVRRGN